MPVHHFLTLPWLAFSLSITLAACGGGSDSPATAPASTAPLPSPALIADPATASASAATSGGGDISCGLNAPDGIQAEVLQRINTLRAAGAVCGTTTYAPTSALSWNLNLLQSARGHSADMAANNYFSHTGRDGRSPAQRAVAAGYSYSIIGENIAAGQTSVENVMTAWATSESHCRNLMNPLFRDIAVACVRNDASTYSLYWAMELAKPL